MPVESVASQSATESAGATNQTAESFREPLGSNDSKSEPIPQKELRDAAGNASTQRSVVSRLSSQSIVLFLILAIAIMGIVIGNRGGEDGTDVTSPLKETLLTDKASLNEADGLVEKTIDSAAGAAESASDQTTPSKSTGTKHADLAANPSNQAKPSDQPLSPNVVADVQDSVASDETDMLDQEQTTQTSVDSAPLPQSGTQDALVAEPVQKTSDPNTSDAENNPNASVAMLGTPALVEPSGDQGAASVAVSPSSTGPSSTASTIGYTQTQTPVGISDWLLYLPSVDGAIEKSGTLAVSETPQSPIASYQQYLDSLNQSESPTTAPVGYSQDSDSGSPYATTGTQAQLPVPTNMTQRR